MGLETDWWTLGVAPDWEPPAIISFPSQCPSRTDLSCYHDESCIVAWEMSSGGKCWNTDIKTTKTCPILDNWSKMWLQLYWCSLYLRSHIIVLSTFQQQENLSEVGLRPSQPQDSARTEGRTTFDFSFVLFWFFFHQRLPQLTTPRPWYRIFLSLSKGLCLRSGFGLIHNISLGISSVFGLGMVLVEFL